MGRNRDLVFEECQPEDDLAFPPEEYKERLQRIRERMDKEGIDVLWLMAPESLYYVSGYKCEWYQAQSPKQCGREREAAIRRGPRRPKEIKCQPDWQARRSDQGCDGPRSEPPPAAPAVSAE